MDGFFNKNKPGKTSINVSVAMMHQQFHPCSISFIKNVCKGYCCEGTTGLSIPVVEGEEQDRIESLGATIQDGLMYPDERGLCPFKNNDGLCAINDKKPFSCTVSPFSLNKTDTLIVRNRYRMLLCYKCENSMPAYLAHRWSLVSIFGEEETRSLIETIEFAYKRGIKTAIAHMDTDKYNKFRVSMDKRLDIKPIPCNTRKANSPIRENLNRIIEIDAMDKR